MHVCMHGEPTWRLSLREDSSLLRETPPPPQLPLGLTAVEWRLWIRARQTVQTTRASANWRLVFSLCWLLERRLPTLDSSCAADIAVLVLLC